jgi:NAD(P)-dependent dehydrogenase (short-subunit alcohol dehydrogenase family)
MHDRGDVARQICGISVCGKIAFPLLHSAESDNPTISPAAVFLASSDAKYITGETLRIAGGLR